MSYPTADPLVTPEPGLVILEEMTEKTMPYEQALANSQPTVVEFYADWCSTSSAIAPTLDQLHQQY